MIDIKNLNDTPMEDIFEEAKKQILYQSNQWTNFQESDPGITLVELFSWLKFVQHEYLNRISTGVKMKFLNLLDIFPYTNRGSETLLEVSNIDKDIELPVRTKWKSKNMIFENLYQQILIKSKILSIVFENPEFPSQEEYYKLGSKKAFFLFGKDIDRKNDKNAVRRFTINFDSPLPTDSVINMYFSIYVSKGLARNPIGPDDKFEDMACVKWEYYGRCDNKEGWHKIEIINDDTHNFLFSGIIKMKIKGKSLPLNEQYKLRATLESDEYDYPPRIDNILPNVFRVVQNESKCQNIIIRKEDILTNRTIKLLDNLTLYGESEIYFKAYNGWVKTEIPTVERNADSGETVIKLHNIWDKIKAQPHNEEVIMIVSYEKNLANKITLGSGTNISAQNISIGFQNILMDDLEIMISEQIEGEEVFYKWKRVNDLFSSSKYDRHYILDKENSLIIFGDHEHGMAPRMGNGNIKICSLRETYGENSNTKEDMIDKVISDNECLKNCRVRQIKEATFGRDEESLSHAQARAAEMFSNPQRAVTKADYERIVKSTPGLTFTNVKILPNYMPGHDASNQNCVTIAVRWNKKVGLTLPPSFEKNIMNHLEKYRLINTQIKIVSPEYVGLIIGGIAIVDSSYRIEDRFIESEIKRFIKQINLEMGRTLHFGDLFGMIDRLKCVSSLSKLRISAIGNNTQKDASEDILIPPNGVYYIEKIDFSYIKNSEIYRS